LTADPLVSAPDEPEDIVINFEKGLPVSIDSKSTGKKTSPTDVFLAANALARKHGVGRIDIVENRFIGVSPMFTSSSSPHCCSLNIKSNPHIFDLSRN
jgi:argininosuccinate synthase